MKKYAISYAHYLLKIIMIFGLMISSLSVDAQDPQFSQFYATSLHINPAFTGNTTNYRLFGIYRNQWPAIPGAFVSYAFAYDKNLSGLNSGVGLMFTNDKAGSGGLKFTNVAGLYSYFFKINRKIFVRAGVKMSYTFRGIDRSKLIFSDQIIRDGATSSLETIKGGVNYFDASSGAIIFSEKFWFGTSFDHITKPHQELIAGGDVQLPMKFSLHGGYKFVLEEGIKNDVKQSITAAFNYKHQLYWNQFDIGAYYTKDILVLGAWYRGIPIFANSIHRNNNDAIILLAGFKVKNLSFGYTYDITISRLAGNSGGSHEIAIVYESFRKKKKGKRRRSFIIPCPKF